MNRASEGASAAPDAWVWSAGGGVLAKETSSSFVEYGNASAKITKMAGDADYSILEQVLTPLHLPTGYYTICGRVHCNVASGVALFIHDGSTYNVTATHTGGGSFETLKATFNISSYSGFKVGVICYQVDGAATYLDSLALYRGECAPYYSPNPADFAPICQGYDDDGTFTNLHGGLRQEYIKVTGTLSGGAGTQETITVTLTHGCQAILIAHAEPYTFGTTLPKNVTAQCANYTATQFDINLNCHSGNFTASEAYEMRCMVHMRGWDSGTEVFGE